MTRRPRLVGPALGPLLGRRLVDGLVGIEDGPQFDIGFLTPERPMPVTAAAGEGLATSANR